MPPYCAACVRVLLCTLLLFPTLASAEDPLTSGETAVGMRAGEKRSFVEVRGDRLSVQLEGPPWGDVLTELERQTGLPFHLQGALEGTVTEAFEGLPLEQGLRRLLRRANLILLYAGAKDTHRSGSHVAQVWILPKGGEPPPEPVQLPERPSPAAKDAAEVIITHAQAVEGGEEGQQAARTEYRDPRIRESLTQALQDADVQVRVRAAYGLAEFKDDAAVHSLSAALLEDESEEVRETAAAALGRIARPQAIAVLVTALTDASANVRWSTADALGMIGGVRAIDALQQTLGDEDEMVRERVAGVLQRLTGSTTQD